MAPTQLSLLILELIKSNDNNYDEGELCYFAVKFKFSFYQFFLVLIVSILARTPLKNRFLISMGFSRLNKG